MLVLPKLFEGEFVTKPANAANINDEQIIDLRWRGLKLLQKRNLFGFTSDSLALAKFVGSHPSYQTVCDLGSGSGGLLLLLWALNPQAQCCGLELLATNVQLAQTQPAPEQTSAGTIPTLLFFTGRLGALPGFILRRNHLICW